jgi:hypothetical protein
LETAATGNETVGEGVFYPGRKHTIWGAADKWTHREKRDTEERNRREIKDADQGRSKQQIRRGTRADPRHNVRGSEHIVKRDCNDD